MKKFRFTLRGKMFATSFIVAIAVMVMSLSVMYTYSLRAIESNAENYIYESMKYADANLNIMIDDANKISLAMATNKVMLDNLIFSDLDEASFEWFKLQKQTTEHLNGMVSYKNHILMAAIVRMDGRCVQTSGNLLLRNITTQNWFEDAAQGVTVQIFYNAPEEKRIFLCRPIRYAGETKAVAIVELDFELLSQVYNVAPLQQAKIVTFTRDGDCIFSNTEQYLSANIENTPLAKAMGDYTPDKKYYNIDGQKMLMVHYSSPTNGLNTVGIISYNTLIVDALQIRSQMMVIILFAAILAFTMSLLFSNLIYRGITNMNRSMNDVQMGNLQSRVYVSGNDEMSDMANLFNRMMDEIQLLMNELQNKEKQKREAEQNALMSQIQPHFICNAINGIKYMAHMNGQQEIEDVSTALVELLRGVLSNMDEFVPLWQEAEYINDYIKIQQFKHNRSYTLSWDVEENLWQTMLPKLILQPIVENAILHGIAEMDDGCVNIQIYEHSGILHCKIIDNGKGMSQSEIEQLTLGGKINYSQFRKIGFANVVERIKLIYGKQYGGNVTSFPGEFTCVELSMPVQRGGKEV